MFCVHVHLHYWSLLETTFAESLVNVWLHVSGLWGYEKMWQTDARTDRQMHGQSINQPTDCEIYIGMNNTKLTKKLFFIFNNRCAEYQYLTDPLTKVLEDNCCVNHFVLLLHGTFLFILNGVFVSLYLLPANPLRLKMLKKWTKPPKYEKLNYFFSLGFLGVKNLYIMDL